MKRSWKVALDRLHAEGVLADQDFICGICHDEFRADQDVIVWENVITGEIMLLHEQCHVLSLYGTEKEH